ncbi:MAG: hypothetical protein ACI4RA_10960, partial [Kiritimatiellia bacterium]
SRVFPSSPALYQTTRHPTMAGSRTISQEQLEADIAAGAPVNEDGSMNIIAYAAWILKGNLNGD